MALELIGLHDFVAQPYSGKVTKAFHSTPSGSETTAKKPAWGVKLPPLTLRGLTSLLAKLSVTHVRMQLHGQLTNTLAYYDLNEVNQLEIHIHTTYTTTR